MRVMIIQRIIVNKSSKQAEKSRFLTDKVIGSARDVSITTIASEKLAISAS